MTIRNLDKMFSPCSVALFGASDEAGSVGKTATDNLLGAGFKGPVWLVNPHHKKIAGQKCWRNVEALPEAPDLAIIATPPETVPGLIHDLGKMGTRAVVVITSGIDELTQKTMLEAAQPYCLRIMGPNCFGLMNPQLDLNASFAHLSPAKGDLAFVSQSGAMIGSMIGWAKGKGIGFSSIVSLGNMVDVDVGDVLDYLAMDLKTHAILIYLEQVTDARKFMSAARAAARIKPVIVIKSGRHAEGAKAAKSHTGAMAGTDAVYDAAFRRAGLVRVTDLEELFNAAEILGRVRPFACEKLAIITNGGGAGVLAVDRLVDFSGQLATLSPETIKALDEILPVSWSKMNPVDIVGDAGPERYARTLEVVLSDKGVGAVLVINCPTALAPGTRVAQAVIDTLKKTESTKPILASWLGDAQTARDLLNRHDIPVYETPEDAIRGFSYLIRHARSREILMRTPPALHDSQMDLEPSEKIIKTALREGRTLLTEPEAKDILKSYGIPVVATVTAATPGDVYTVAGDFLKESNKVAVKILSKKITHKSDAGGVALGLRSAEEARNVAQKMFDRLGSEIEGFTVQPMVEKSQAYELILGISDDITFGPVILFGAGGAGTEIVNDKAIALPPLDMNMARDLIAQTRISKLLEGYRNRPRVALDEISLTLVKLSRLAADFPAIRELDINPLLADEAGVIALDARIVVQESSITSGSLNSHMAIRPYPRQWDKPETLSSGKTICIRPIKPEDERYYDAFFKKADIEDIRLRFFAPLRHFSHELIALLTQVDYARTMAFVALDPQTDEMLGVSRLVADPDYTRAECAIMTRSDVKGQGIGWALMKRLIDYAAAENIGELWSEVTADNAVMLNMCDEFGFQMKHCPYDPCLMLTTLSLGGKKAA